MLNLKGKDLGRYHLIEPLGEGGMAMVYKAYDATLDRNVAIKVIRTEIGGDPTFLQRFQREAKALAKLDHPYILKVLDYGEQEGLPYLVMPFVAGGTLKARMGSPTSPGETARILAPIARALAYAHQQGIIHRDVKPANILITPTGEPMLSDFGIAKMLENEGHTQLTATGVGMGTPDYMAPEQWLGTVDARTDVYALGVILFQMITGRLPYSADTPAAVLLKHMQDPLPRPGDFVPGLADSVERVIFKALAKDPADRFHSMDRFAEALERMAQSVEQSPQATIAAPQETMAAPFDTPVGSTFPTRQAYSAQPAPAPARRGMPWLPVSGRTLALIAVGCLVLGAISFILLRNPQKASQAPTPSPAVMIVPSATIVKGEAATPTGIMVAAAPPAAIETPSLLQDTPMSILTMAAQLVTATPKATGTKLPALTKIEGMPDDIPILKDNNGDLMRQESDRMNMFIYSTVVTPKEAADFFKTEMVKLGWRIQNSTTMESQEAYMYYFQKSGRTVMISISTGDGKTMVSVMVQQ